MTTLTAAAFQSLTPQSESALQIECVRYFRLQYPQYGKLFYHVANGGKRDKITAVVLKRQGVVSGVSDLQLSVARRGYHGMYIELKVGKNKLTEEQSEFQNAAKAQGYYCCVCRTIDEFIERIKWYLK